MKTRRARFRAVLGNKSRRYKYEKWFWICTLVPGYVWLHDTRIITALSIYALIITAGGAEQAAEAAIQATETNEET